MNAHRDTNPLPAEDWPCPPPPDYGEDGGPITSEDRRHLREWAEELQHQHDDVPRDLGWVALALVSVSAVIVAFVVGVAVGGLI